VLAVFPCLSSMKNADTFSNCPTRHSFSAEHIYPIAFEQYHSFGRFYENRSNYEERSGMVFHKNNALFQWVALDLPPVDMFKEFCLSKVFLRTTCGLTG